MGIGVFRCYYFLYCYYPVIIFALLILCFSNVSLSYLPLIFSLFIICIENMNLDKHVFVLYIEKYILACVIDKGLEYPSDRRICCHKLQNLLHSFFFFYQKSRLRLMYQFYISLRYITLYIRNNYYLCRGMKFVKCLICNFLRRRIHKSILLRSLALKRLFL